MRYFAVQCDFFDERKSCGAAFSESEPLFLFFTTVKIALTVTFGLGICLIYLLFSPEGLKTALSLITELTPYQITYSHIEGRLLDRVYIRDLNCTSPRFNLTAQSLRLHYQFTDLLLPKPYIREAQAKNLTLIIHEKENKPENAAPSDSIAFSTTAMTSPQLHLPLGLSIKQVFLENAAVVWKHKTYTADQLIIHSVPHNDTYQIASIFYAGNCGNMQAYFGDEMFLEGDLGLKHCHCPIL